MVEREDRPSVGLERLEGFGEASGVAVGGGRTHVAASVVISAAGISRTRRRRFERNDMRALFTTIRVSHASNASGSRRSPS